MAEQFDKIAAEQKEINSLLERGVKFKIPRRGLSRLLHKGRPRRWVIKEPYLGTLDRLSDLYIKIQIDDKALKEDPIGVAKAMTHKTAKLCARVVAIAVLNDRLMIRLFSRILARHFLWHITPTTLIGLTSLINTMGNYPDFIASIRLMSSARTTMPIPAKAPNLVEQLKRA